MRERAGGCNLHATDLKYLLQCSRWSPPCWHMTLLSRAVSAPLHGHWCGMRYRIQAMRRTWWRIGRSNIDREEAFIAGRRRRSFGEDGRGGPGIKSVRRGGGFVPSFNRAEELDLRFRPLSRSCQPQSYDKNLQESWSWITKSRV
jgi:hypothetical protein